MANRIKPILNTEAVGKMRPKGTYIIGAGEMLSTTFVNVLCLRIHIAHDLCIWLFSSVKYVSALNITLNAPFPHSFQRSSYFVFSI